MFEIALGKKSLVNKWTLTYVGENYVYHKHHTPSAGGAGACCSTSSPGPDPVLFNISGKHLLTSKGDGSSFSSMFAAPSTFWFSAVNDHLNLNQEPISQLLERGWWVHYPSSKDEMWSEAKALNNPVILIFFTQAWSYTDRFLKIPPESIRKWCYKYQMGLEMGRVTSWTTTFAVSGWDYILKTYFIQGTWESIFQKTKP